jgi:hypothetical protein
MTKEVVDDQVAVTLLSAIILQNTIYTVIFYLTTMALFLFFGWYAWTTRSADEGFLWVAITLGAGAAVSLRQIRPKMAFRAPDTLKMFVEEVEEPEPEPPKKYVCPARADMFPEVES